MCTEHIASLEACLSVLYDVGTTDGWEAACRYRRWWGVLYTVIHWLDEDTVILEFRPSPRPWWRPWEEVRLRMILEDLDQDLGEGRAA